VEDASDSPLEDFSEVCPVCGADVGLTCDHLVAVRLDDDGVGEALAPIYFGNGAYCGEGFDELFKAIVDVALMWKQLGKRRRHGLENEFQRLAPPLQELMQWVSLRLQDDPNPADFDGYEDRHDYIAYGLLALERPLHTVLERCWRLEPTAISTCDYEISHSPGLTWTGSVFWARNATECATGIGKRVLGYADAVRGISRQGK